MLNIRRARDRGHSSLRWLDSRHTFSFAEYYDPRHMGYGMLRVINEDRVVPGAGFGTHSHADMEILSWVLHGALEHKDSIGTGSIIRPGELQRMTAGTGIAHSEFNSSQRDPVHFLQIWILPERRGLAPGYEQKSFGERLDRANNELTLIASRDGHDESITIHQDANLYAARLGAGASVEHRPVLGRQLWMQLARGAATLNGEDLQAGDGVAIEQEALLQIATKDEAEILLFDMRGD